MKFDMEDFLDRLSQAESSGGKHLTNKSTSAAGPFQFTEKTGRKIAADLGLDPERWRDYAMDPTMSRAMARELTTQNRAYFHSKTGQEADMQQSHLAHFAGGSKAVAAYRNPQGTPAQLLDPGQQKANTEVMRRTGKSGQTLAQWSAQTIGMPQPAGPFQSQRSRSMQPQPAYAGGQEAQKGLAPPANQPPQQDPFQEYPEWAKQIPGFNPLPGIKTS